MRIEQISLDKYNSSTSIFEAGINRIGEDSNCRTPVFNNLLPLTRERRRDSSYTKSQPKTSTTSYAVGHSAILVLQQLRCRFVWNLGFMVQAFPIVSIVVRFLVEPTIC